MFRKIVLILGLLFLSGRAVAQQPDTLLFGATGALGAINNTITISNPGTAWSDVNIQFLTGSSPSMTVTFQSSVDGVTFNSRVCRQTDITGVLSTTTTTFPSEWRCNGAGMTAFQVQVTSYTSGSTTANIRASLGTGPVFLNAPLPTGTNSIGSVVTESQKASYRAASLFSPVATTATDIFTITGSATKTVRVTRLGIACTATAAIAADVVFLIRSTADTAGTSTAPARVPLDSTDAAASATVLAYTANPTTGTLVGNISADKASITSATGAPQFYFEDFSTRNTKAAVLRGITQVLAINLNSASIAGIACDAEVEWSEE